MGLTNKNVFLIIFLFLLTIASLSAQALALSQEIERLGRLSQIPEQRHGALVQLARLYQLSGDRERALEYWTLAVHGSPNNRDDRALLEAIKLLISMGEYEKAAAELTTIILSSQDVEVQLSAYYLSGKLLAFRNRDGSLLSYFAENPRYREVQSRIFYTLWVITQDASWKTRLLDSYPLSPEAEIVRDNNRIIAAVTPQWLFFPERESLVLMPPVYATAPSAELASVPAVHAQAAASTAVPVLQTGIFSQEDNAKIMADRLLRAGFQSEIRRRTVNGVEHWAVLVRPGPDISESISALRTAGFEAFQIRE